ncbi:hypothetical protein MHYP_G00127260 [Metynnis hypsauchen]
MGNCHSNAPLARKSSPDEEKCIHCPAIPEQPAPKSISPSHYCFKGLFHSLPIPACPWSHVSLDFVTGLTPSKGTVILFLVDHFSKACKFVALPKLPSAKETVELLLQHVVRIHGMPSDLVSDRDLQFASRFWKAFCRLMGASVSLSYSFHPMSNGQTERVNQDVDQTLRYLTSTNSSSWVEYAHKSPAFVPGHVTL